METFLQVKKNTNSKLLVLKFFNLYEEGTQNVWYLRTKTLEGKGILEQLI